MDIKVCLCAEEGLYNMPPYGGAHKSPVALAFLRCSVDVLESHYMWDFNSPFSSNRKPQPHLPKKILMEGLLICFCEALSSCAKPVRSWYEQHLNSTWETEAVPRSGLCSRREKSLNRVGKRSQLFTPECDKSITVTLSSHLTEASLSFWAKKSKQRSKNYFQQCPLIFHIFGNRYILEGILEKVKNYTRMPYIGVCIYMHTFIYMCIYFIYVHFIYTIYI